MGRDWNEPEGIVDRYQPGDEKPAQPHGRAAKCRARWCKGRIGVPHAFLWENDPSWTWHTEKGLTRQVKICFGCGRKSHQWRYICRRCGGRRQLYSWLSDKNEAVYTCSCEAERPRRGVANAWRPGGAVMT